MPNTGQQADTPHPLDRYQQLINSLIQEQYLSRPPIIEAFRATPRKNFLRSHHRLFESLDSPLPIGFNQTTSQPRVVAFMLELLGPEPGHHILEIGYGTGWQTALLAKIIVVATSTGSTIGEIYAYEIIEALANFGKQNIQRNLIPELLHHVHLGDCDFQDSFRKHAPYDRIISGAAFDKTPVDLIKALKTSGIMVYPTSTHELRKVTRTSKTKYDDDIFPGFVFVPITHRSSNGPASRHS